MPCQGHEISYPDRAARSRLLTVIDALPLAACLPTCIIVHVTQKPIGGALIVAIYRIHDDILALGTRAGSNQSEPRQTQCFREERIDSMKREAVDR